MAILNVTYQGMSGDYNLGASSAELTDEDIRRTATEVLINGDIPGMQYQMEETAFSNYVVDRFEHADGNPRIYLRPKVPFG